MDEEATGAMTFTFNHRPSIEEGYRATRLRRRGIHDRLLLVAPIAALCVTSFLLIVPSTPVGFYVGFAGLALGFVLLIVNRTRIDPRITAARRARWDAALKNGLAMTINAKGIRAEGPELLMVVPWPAFHELRDDGQILMFWRDPSWALWLEPSAFTSAEQRAELMTFARAHLPRDAKPESPSGEGWR